MHVAHICDLLTFLSSDFFLTAARGRGLITRRRILEGFGNIGEFRSSSAPVPRDPQPSQFLCHEAQVEGPGCRESYGEARLHH